MSTASELRLRSNLGRGLIARKRKLRAVSYNDELSQTLVDGAGFAESLLDCGQKNPAVVPRPLLAILSNGIAK